ncbi:alpha/beta fold hydrolase [Symbioplanes lichenis]|uniref:alpha/beta fold hydrolase n=1 Tax=Symbioplanes lichenis TaxID=1629072 RepID=UPI002739D95D|nr:alpha/beta fold hydrolase [Actinoplanes lichenis]
MTGLERGTIERDGVRLSFLIGGEGPPVVLLHGLAGSAEEFAPTARALLPDHRVVALDQRGHGHSTRRPADLSRRAYADDVAAVIEHAGGPVTLVGQSMGGHTALLVAAWHPELVERLILVEAGVGGTDDPDAGRRIEDFFAGWPVPFVSREAAAEHLGGTPIAHAWAADLDGDLRPRFDADVMGAAIAPVLAAARWDEWAAITAATLLVRGERGIIPQAEVDRMLELQPAARLVEVAGAEHDVHLDQPEAWYEILRTAATERQP